jgi:hypothetical protein
MIILQKLSKHLIYIVNVKIDGFYHYVPINNSKQQTSI